MVGHTQIGILLGRDLIFTNKVQSTAHTLGYQVEVIGEKAKARVEIESLHPRLVLIDLTAGELSSPASIMEYLAIAGSQTWFIAFGPHVESESLAAARAAGCHVVLPRSKFAADLPRLLQLYFSELPPAD